jgi:hypothetical protein
MVVHSLRNGVTMMLAKCLMPLAVLALAACSTPYQEMGFLGGVNATQIDATTMRISSRGNGFSDIGRMKDYVLLKAAEETVQHGYDLFQVVDAENVSRTDHFSIPEFHSQPVVATGFGPYGPVTAFGSVTYTTDRDQAVNKPGEDVTIRMFSGPKPANAPANLFAAREIIMFLGPQIRPDAQAASVASDTPVLPNPPPQAVEQPAAPPLPACTASDRKIARLARANGYQYSGNCQ